MEIIKYLGNDINNPFKNQTFIQKLKKVKPEFDDFYSIIREKMVFNTEGKCINSFEILSDVNILSLAYNSIKSKPGNMVKGSDKETLDGINKDWFIKTNQLLRKEA